jgi:hypothetical protein
MPTNGLVKVTLTKYQAEWLYDLLTETFDEGSSTNTDEINCNDIADKLDAELNKI